jgi:transposase
MSVAVGLENVLSVGDLNHPSMEGELMIVIGVDAHIQTHTAAAVVADTAVLVDTMVVAARLHGHMSLLTWARAVDPDRVWALEDCRRLTAHLERVLLQAGERVVRVPPKLMVISRKAERTYAKSDAIDAISIARAAVREPELPAARLPGIDQEIRLLLDHRDDLLGECTRHQRRLRWYLHEIDPDLQPPRAELAAPKHLDKLDRELTEREQTAVVKISRELLGMIRDLTRRSNQLKAEITRLVRRRCPALLSVQGCGVLMAARILAEVDGISRFPSERHLAAYAGTNPLQASSGQTTRHRLNRTGNRKLNMALHVIAITQLRVYQPARDYVDRRRSDGKSTREALRALKRFIVRRIFQVLTTGLIDPTLIPAGQASGRCV